jgi:ankyrin repeat protein
MFVTVSQEGRTALMWAAIKGHKEIVKALIGKVADVEAKEKVRSRYCVITGTGSNDQRMFGTGLCDLGATGRKDHALFL